MKAVILAGGFGTRLSEETGIVPKPLIEIGGRPMLWHIMKIYAAHDVNDFIVCCGYKGNLIKDYFVNYYHRNSDITVDLSDNSIEVRRPATEPWRVTLVDTGPDSLTGGRIKRVREHIGGETFCMTYGDGVSNIDIGKLLAFHRDQGTLATVTAVHLPGRFGALDFSGDDPKVKRIREKSLQDGQTINGGFFVLEPQVLDYIDGDLTTWEEEPLQRLVAEGELSVYRHDGFWQNMDTLRDKHLLQSLWDGGAPPWKIWS
ncbi:glucose-1-phosphate cytidylyltransferase [Cereibacter changlensis]|uniref:Glucose-1-phosphate cytidylyltransferase n=1 Tax=Cereibacter changlensis TaxID=402884 RepID=A0A4U0Z570_9RHOB|nr:glucose-1-phosphate cytidylyltransferase [Cereibacter changlensis]TKA96653.1 glucose-1-phosphate cytidylyltransferase [Cereibacter changlensis]